VFEDALADPAYMEMREESALLYTFLVDAVERSQAGRDAALWEDLERALEAYTTAGTADYRKSKAALEDLRRTVAEGANAYRARQEAMDIVERRRKVAESERKRVADEQLSISAARALAFAGTVFALLRQAVATHVGGQVEERLILADVQAGLAERIRQDVGRGAGAPTASLPGGAD